MDNSIILQAIITQMLTKRAAEAIEYRPTTQQALEYIIRDAIPRCETVEQLDWAVQCEIWRYIDGNEDGTMFQILKNNDVTRHFFKAFKEASA